MNYYAKLAEEKRNKKQPYKQYVLEVKKYLSSYLCGILTSTGKLIYEDYADTEEEGFSKLRRVVDKYKSNSKEEKDNYEHPFEHLIKLAKQKGYPDLVKHLQEHKMEYLKDTSRIFARIKGLEGLPDKTNSDEEKDNANFHYLGRSWSVTEGNYKEVRKQIEQAYKDKVADLERKISRSTGTEEHRYKEELRELKGNHRESMEEFDWGYGNSKDKGYYQSIIEKKNADPEESMRKLQALKPIVDAFKRKGMTKHEVAMRLMQERDITETLAQQCVDTWY